MNESTTLADIAARRVKQLRQERGWSQAVLAQRLRAHGQVTWGQGQIAKIETGLYRLDRLPDLIAMCEVFHVSLDALLAGEGTVQLGKDDDPSGRRELAEVRLAIKGKGRATDAADIAADDPYDIDRIVKRAGLGDELELAAICTALWHESSFLTLRDRRANFAPGDSPATMAARRGYATKQMLAEMSTAIDEFGLNNLLEEA